MQSQNKAKQITHDKHLEKQNSKTCHDTFILNVSPHIKQITHCTVKQNAYFRLWPILPCQYFIS